MNEPDLGSFEKFHERWTEQLQQLVHHLRDAQIRRRAAASSGDGEEEEEDQELVRVVGRVMSHCRDYKEARRVATERDVVGVVAAPWLSALERSLQWVGGWRPTTVFHLVYTESSILFESRIIDILRGLRTGDLSDLSPSQFRTVSDLQCETVKEENAITEELSEWQDDASELVAGTAADLEERLRRLADIVHRADDLRLRAITGVVDLLSPLQAAEFLTAAVELQTGVRRWGMNHDRHRSHA